MARPRTIDPSGEVVRFTISLPDKTRKRLQRKAKQQGVSLSEVVREALEKVA